MSNKIKRMLRDVERCQQGSLEANVDMRLDKVLYKYIEDLNRALERLYGQAPEKVLKEIAKYED